MLSFFTLSSPAQQPRSGRAARHVVGVDMGHWGIGTVRLERKSGGKFALADWREDLVGPQTPIDSPGFSQLLRQNLNEVCGKRKQLEIWAALVPDRVRVFPLKVPAGKPEQLAQTVYWAVQREEAFRAESSLFDFEILEDPTVPDSQRSVIAYLAPKEDIAGMERQFRQIGYPLSGLILPINALRNFTANGWIRSEAGSCTVWSHVGESASRIHVMEGACVRLTRGIPIGMETLKEAISSADSPAGEDAIRFPLERMARQIERTVEFYQSSSGKFGSVTSVHFAGSLAADTSSVELLQAQLSLPLQVLDPFHQDHLEHTVDAPDNKATRWRLATAMAMALSSLDSTPNFLLTHSGRQQWRKAHRIQQAILAAFLLSALLLGGWYAFERAANHELRAERAALEAQLRLPDRAVEPGTLLKDLTALREELRPLHALAQRRHAVALLTEISLLTPANIRMQVLDATLAELDPGSAASSGRLELHGWIDNTTGTAQPQLQEFLSQLNASVWMRSVELLEHRHDTGLDRDYFAIAMELAPLKEGTR